jgi:glycosyltransferase involved in cell wall biosynthesis
MEIAKDFLGRGEGACGFRRERVTNALEGVPCRVAVVHDWLPQMGGAEKVLAQILKIFPSADVFTLLDFLSAEDRKFLASTKVSTSWVQHLPFARTRYRLYLPLMPLAVEGFDLASYQLVISSSYAVAKGVITGPNQLHLCYCHSPVRYAWDMQEQYLVQSRRNRGLSGMVARMILHYIRLWDSRTPNGVDSFAANSRFVARRIWKVYRRRSRIIYPPVPRGPLGSLMQPVAERKFYVSVGRLVPYKRVDLIVEAFRRMPGRRIKIIGSGPQSESLRARCPRNVEFLGRQPQSVVDHCLSGARGFVFAAEEDFGIAPVEAQAAGTPVVAYGRGGAQESVIDGVTGVLFGSQTPEAIVDAVERAEGIEFSPAVLKSNADRFSEEQFRREITRWVGEEWALFSSGSVEAFGDSAVDKKRESDRAKPEACCCV